MIVKCLRYDDPNAHIAAVAAIIPKRSRKRHMGSVIHKHASPAIAGQCQARPSSARSGGFSKVTGRPRSNNTLARLAADEMILFSVSMYSLYSRGAPAPEGSALVRSPLHRLSGLNDLQGVAKWAANTHAVSSRSGRSHNRSKARITLGRVTSCPSPPLRGSISSAGT